MAQSPSRAPYIESPALSPFTLNWRHGFFGREGGVSTGVYKSLNTGPGSSDQGNRVKANRDRICVTMGALPGRMITLRQAHTNKAIIVDGPLSVAQAPEADAIVTATPGLVITALAADCAPILVGDPKANVIAAIHAGWRGAVTGVIESAIESMQTLGASPENMIAAIGPCISKESFEVGPDFEAAFLDVSPWCANLFEDGEGDRLKFDLKQYCSARLIRAGVGKSEIIADDTYSQPEKYFSYRRSKAEGASDYGRNASSIMLVA
ncbi:peptidoglycan editing factor PgeF [Hirschia litorea]|uniref:Purine nucleoside phosphorylase n=1 Tax=Hirschia litorea TaxID=1199156 RepID=A0ABW2IKB7_9PROT